MSTLDQLIDTCDVTEKQKRKLGIKGAVRSYDENKAKNAVCEGCGKEDEKGTGGFTMFTEIWQVGGDKSSRKLLCDDCLKDIKLNPRCEVL